jgi:hypothetical protein
MPERNEFIITISPQAKEDIQNILFYLSQNRNQKIVDEFVERSESFYFTVAC